MNSRLGRPIVVVGSVNMDFVCATTAAPRAGETVVGSSFLMNPGGKGANQPVAVARLSGGCRFIARVGDDALASDLRSGLMSQGVDCAHVLMTPGVSSGAAMVTLESGGENRIVFVPGANARLSPDDIERAAAAFDGAGTCVMQLEIPRRTAIAAVAQCRQRGIRIVVDPAPAVALPDELYSVDVLTPNESEAEVLLGAPNAGRLPTSTDHRQRAWDLLRRGPQAVVLKLGAEGALAAWKAIDDRSHLAAAFEVEAVDTTGAGDAFTAGLAVALEEGKDWPEALRFANAAGALACTAVGGQSSMPWRQVVEDLLQCC